MNPLNPLNPSSYPSSFLIERCYDSHVHLFMTGEKKLLLDLSSLKNPDEIQNLKIEKHHFRGDWILGFGWDQNQWPNQQMPSKKSLDLVFPDTPVCFTRIDGHALWLNSIALKKLNLSSSSSSTGIVFDDCLAQVMKQIPSYTIQEKREILLSGVKYFNQNGFTHIRDLSGTEEQWLLLSEMDEAKQLSCYIDQAFFHDKTTDLSKVIQIAQEAKQSYQKKIQTKMKTHLRVAGVKIFYDGALGSEGAYLSAPYLTSSQDPAQNQEASAQAPTQPPAPSVGYTLWTKKELKNIIKTIWLSKLTACIHVIGDQAVHEVSLIAEELYQENLKGLLHLEHVELIRPETLKILKKLNCYCHLQPCHFLSDVIFLKQKLGDLYKYIFPWKALYDLKIPHSWGSDSPIEEASIFKTIQGLNLASQEGIPSYPSSSFTAFEHPDPSWGADCWTLIKDNKIFKVCWDGVCLS